MMRFEKWFCIGLLAGVPTLTAAQEPQRGPLIPQVLSTQANSQPRSAQTAMYEDIEIMRRILNRDLHAFQQATCASCHQQGMIGSPFLTHNYDGFMQAKPGQNLLKGFYPGVGNLPMSGGFPGSSTTIMGNGGWVDLSSDGSIRYPNPNASWSTGTTNNLPTVAAEGTYLKDYGVVFHVTMPAPALLPTTKLVPAQFPAKPESEWERVRKELHGEKLNKASPSAPKNVPDTADFLLKLLADNGSNFSHLGDKENLTVIVTFRPAADPHHGSLARLNPVEPGYEKPSSGTSSSQNMSGYWVTNEIGSGTTAGSAGPSGGGDFELLGDLQVKQGRVQEAIKAYQQAVNAQTDLNRKASLYQKLAQAHLKMEPMNDNAISKAIEYLKLAQKNADSTGRATNPKAIVVDSPAKLLTSKLIVTVPKKVLDEALKNLTFDQFRAAARVERIAIPYPEKQGNVKGSAQGNAPGKN